jgi:hypothetical protein
MSTPFFGWFQIIRLGLIQACLGAVVVVTTSTLNRIMVVELALPALLPGFLVAWHYAVQMVRPRMGFGADKGQRSTPWMMGHGGAGCGRCHGRMGHGVDGDRTRLRRAVGRLVVQLDWFGGQRLRYIAFGLDGQTCAR